MNGGLAVGLVLLVAGVIVFAIGATGTFSLIQALIGVFLAVVGAFALVAAIKG